MNNPLSLFIEKPSEWTLVHRYGDQPRPPLTEHYTLLETSGDGYLVAACSGKISAIIPGSGVDSDVTLPVSPRSMPPISSIDLYLHVWPSVSVQPDIQNNLPGRSQLIGFAYLNVDPASLEPSLKELLDAAYVGGTMTRKQVVDMLAAGLLSIRVSHGDHIGQAAATTGGKKQLGFAVLTQDGPMDPGYVFEKLNQNYMEGLNELVNLTGKAWPVVSVNTKSDALDITKQNLYPMPVLKDLLRTFSLTDSEWRAIGNHQKELWHQLLLKRVGWAAQNSTVPPFDFGLLDWRNVFQLEALTEFYANFDDPWKTNSAPKDPVSSDYKTLNFLDPSGNGAVFEKGMNGELHLSIVSKPDLSRVKQGYDTVYVMSEASGETTETAFLIEEIEETNNGYLFKLESGAQPSVGPHYWRISLSPILVLVDPFGPRITGETIYDPDYPETVTLLNCSKEDMIRVNRFFDTIYFFIESESKMSFRILERDADNSLVTLDRVPQPFGRASFQIPAGICSKAPVLYHDLLSGSPNNYKDYPNSVGAYGYDHVDGVIFVIKNGQVRAMYRWSSFTSRINGKAPEWLSSVRGNKEYDIFSTCSGFPDKCHQNYCFAVVDQGNKTSEDFVRSARFYFRKKVTDDSFSGAGGPKQNLGKEGIRLHWSRSRKGQKACNKPDTTGHLNSAGCLVSPLFEQFRAKIVELYQYDYSARTKQKHVKLQRVAALLSHEASEKAFLSDAQRNKWAKVLRCTLWVIRPDERPLG